MAVEKKRAAPAPAPPLDRRPINTIELMRVNTPDQLEHMHPRVNCHKCGKQQWAREKMPLTWGCLCCGNLIYLEMGEPVQQIDIVRRARAKHEDEECFHV